MKVRRLDAMTEDQIKEVYLLAEASRTAPLPFSFRTFSQLIRQPAMVLYVLEDWPDILAFALFRLMGPEAELYYVTVAKDYKKQGLGRALLGQILEDLRREGLENIYLEVRESNWAARKLYEVLDFEVYGRREKYYRAPTEAALLMRLDLKEEANDKDIGY